MIVLPPVLMRKLVGWRGDLVALAAGAITPLAFAPVAAWPLAIVSLFLLFLTWLDAAPKRAAWRGGLWGVGCFGLGINWIFISVHTYGYVPYVLALLITAALVLFMSLYPALVGYLLGRFFPVKHERLYSRFKILLVLPALWVLVEWFRGWFMTGFPWLVMGYSQLDSPLAGLAPIMGVYGVSWLLALSAGLIVALVLERKRWWTYAIALPVLWGTSWAVNQINWTQASAPPLAVTLLQGNIPQDLKWHPSVRQPTIDLYTEMTRASWGSDLIIWPESALPAFRYEVKALVEDLNIEAQEHNTDLLIGVLDMDKTYGRYYNSMMSLGQSQGVYYKQHLVPFTEYLPLKELLGNLVRFMQVPMSDFSSGGDEQPLLEVAGQKVGISICFEDAFGEEVIRTVPEASLLVNVSNDAWFADSWAPAQHLQIARMRSLETGRYLMRATNTGMTAVIDHKGQIIAQAPQFEVFALKATVVPHQGTTPYVLFGNWLIVFILLAGVSYSGWRFCYAKKSRPTAHDYLNDEE